MSVSSACWRSQYFLLWFNLLYQTLDFINLPTRLALIPMIAEGLFVNNVFRNTILMLSILTFVGCVSMPVNVTDSSGLKAGHGILIVKLKSDWPNKKSVMHPDLELYYSGDNTDKTFYRGLTFAESEYLAVIELPADKYHFSKLNYGNMYLWLEDTGFVIKENTATYIGDISAIGDGKRGPSSFDLSVEDNFEEVVEAFKMDYPNLTKATSLTKDIVRIY